MKKATAKFFLHFAGSDCEFVVLHLPAVSGRIFSFIVILSNMTLSFSLAMSISNK